jgi:hypothetical protein
LGCPRPNRQSRHGVSDIGKDRKTVLVTICLNRLMFANPLQVALAITCENLISASQVASHGLSPNRITNKVNNF